MSIIESFASRHRLRPRRLAEGEPEIIGRTGSIYGPAHEGYLVLTVFAGSNAARWRAARRKALEAGMALWQDGDDEGSLLFDGSDPAQEKLAIRLAGARQKRQVSPETAARLRTYAEARKTPSQGRKSSPGEAGSHVVPGQGSPSVTRGRLRLAGVT